MSYFNAVQIKAERGYERALNLANAFIYISPRN